MRNGTRNIALALAATMLAAGVAACGGDSSQDAGAGAKTALASSGNVPFTGSLESDLPTCYPKPAERDLVIGFSSPLDATEAVRNLGIALRKQVEQLGGRLVLVDAKGDPDAQVSGMEQLITRKVDGIIVWPLGDKLLAPVLERAEAANIPVLGINVTLDSTDPGPGYVSQIWDGIDYTAYLKARAAASVLPKGAGFGQIGFIQPVPSIEKLVTRAAYWGRKFGLEPLGRADNPTDDIAGGEKAMTELMGKYPDMQGVIAYNEQSATGAAAAARAGGKRDLPLVGANGISVGYGAVREGKITATVKLREADVGRCAAFGIYDAAEGKSIPSTVLAPRPVLLTKANVDKVPSDPELIEQRYGSAD